MENKEKNFVSAVIYVHNAEDRLETFLSNIIEVMEENFEKSEIICVNDYSDDNSVAVIKKISKSVEHTTISILNMSHFHGLEMAMNAGVDLAIGDFVLEFDAVVQDFEKEEIMNVYRKALEGYDIVSASSNKRQRVSSSIFYWIFEKFTNISYKIYTERFRILSRRAINRVGSMNKSVPYRKVAYANCGLKTTNIKYNLCDNCCKKQRDDKMEKRYRKRLAIDTLIVFTEVGYSFSIAMTLIMMLISICVAAYTVIVYITSTPVAGWTTTILFMSVAFLGLFGLLTIIIKYLQIIVDLVFKRKSYNFESIEKLTK